MSSGITSCMPVVVVDTRSFILRPDTNLFTRRCRSADQGVTESHSVGSKIISVMVSFFASTYVMLWPRYIVDADVCVSIFSQTVITQGRPTSIVVCTPV